MKAISSLGVRDYIREAEILLSQYIYTVFSFQLGGAAANRVTMLVVKFSCKGLQIWFVVCIQSKHAHRLYVNEVNLIYENNCHCHFVNNTGGLQLVRFQLVPTALNSAIHRFSAVFSQR